MTKKLVVFDVDGTFLDSISFLEKIANEYSLKIGLPEPDIEAIKHGYGHPREHDFGWGVSREEQENHLYAVFDLMDEYAMSGEPHLTPQLFARVEDTLVHLKDTGHTLAIVTSKLEVPLLHALEYHDLKRLFSTWRSYDHAERLGKRDKPAPDMLLDVMAELKFGPEATAMIGDSTMDMKMGRAAGTGAVGVAWGAHPKHQLVDAGAHHVIETHFGDIVPTVKKVFR